MMSLKTARSVLFCVFYATTSLACSPEGGPENVGNLTWHDEGFDADVDASSDAGISPDADVDASADAGADVDADTDAGFEADADTDADTGTDASAPVTTVSVVVVDHTGSPIEGATVEWYGEGVEEVTDYTGGATLEVEPGEFVVRARPEGGVFVYAMGQVEEGEQATARVQMPALQTTETPQSETERIEVTVGGGEVSLPPAGGLVGPSGEPYMGPVVIMSAGLDPADLAGVPSPAEANPGPDGAQPMVLETFKLSLFTDTGEPLQVADGATITFTRPVTLSPMLLAAVAADATLWLKRFEPEEGEWIESGTATYDDGILTGTLPHLSFYSVWANATVTVEANTETVCGRGTTTPGATVELQARLSHSGTGASIDHVESVVADANGDYCLPLPAAQGTTLTITNSMDPTPQEETSEFVPTAFFVDGASQPLPTFPALNSGDAVCGMGASCVDIAPPPVQPEPTCVANPSVCDDGNACTDETCDPTPCPPGVTCSGCSSAPSAFASACDDGNATTCGDVCDGAGLCVGNPTTLTQQGNASFGLMRSAVNAPVDVQISNASAPSDLFAPAFLAPAVSQGTIDYTVFGARLGTDGGGLIAVVSTDPYVDFANNDDLEVSFAPLSALQFQDSGEVDLEVQAADGSLINANVEFLGAFAVLSVQSDTALDSALPVPFTPGGDDLVLRVSSSGGVTTVTLKQGSTSLASVQLSEALAQADRIDVGFMASDSGTVEDMFELHSIESSSLLATAPQLWTLDAPILSHDGVEYASPGADAPMWFDGGALEETREGGVGANALRPVEFIGEADAIDYYLVSVPQPNDTFLRRTYYSTRPESELQAALDTVHGAGVAIIDARGQAFDFDANAFVADFEVPACQ